jgi:hypothetical protein
MFEDWRYGIQGSPDRSPGMQLPSWFVGDGRYVVVSTVQQGRKPG